MAAGEIFIAAQRLAATGSICPDRQRSRRAQRAGILSTGVVNVVQLRRCARSPAAYRVEGA